MANLSVQEKTNTAEDEMVANMGPVPEVEDRAEAKRRARRAKLDPSQRDRVYRYFMRHQPWAKETLAGFDREWLVVLKAIKTLTKQEADSSDLKVKALLGRVRGVYERLETAIKKQTTLLRRRILNAQIWLDYFKSIS